jgi:hypothetical protein
MWVSLRAFGLRWVHPARKAAAGRASPYYFVAVLNVSGGDGSDEPPQCVVDVTDGHARSQHAQRYRSRPVCQVAGS